MVKVKSTETSKTRKKPQDALKKILDECEFMPDFIPRTKHLFTKKCRLYSQKRIKKKSP